MSKNIVVKVCLLGDPAVGKTSLIRRFVLDQFSDNYLTTIGAKVMKKVITIKKDGEEYSITLMLWDLMGQKEYEFLQSTYYKGAQGAMLVCDLTRKETFDNIPRWIEGIHRVVKNVPFVLAANKKDLDGWEISEDDLKRFSKEKNIEYVLTSAKTGEGVEEAFLMLGKKIIENLS